MPREALGEFEQTVLLAVLQLEDDAYGLAVMDEIVRRTGRRVAPAAVYVALQRLEQKGLVTSRRERPGSTAGRPRRFYRVRPRGRVLLRESRLAMNRLWAGLEHLLAE